MYLSDLSIFISCKILELIFPGIHLFRLKFRLLETRRTMRQVFHYAVFPFTY
jgi:hypothetical protein